MFRSYLPWTLILVAACSGGGGVGEVVGEVTGQSTHAIQACPAATTVEGVDVSEFQGTIDWGAVKASGRAFAFARVSDGLNRSDPTFDRNWADIQAAGMIRGAYQYFRPSEDPIAQADLLLGRIGALAAEDLPPVLDVEVAEGLPADTVTAGITAWVEHVRAALGRAPTIYTMPGFWDSLTGVAPFEPLALWVAHWQVPCPDTPTPWKDWQFWQYDSNGAVPGIAGVVDLDRFNGVVDALVSVGGPAWAAGSSQSFPMGLTAQGSGQTTASFTMIAGQILPSFIELKNVGTSSWDANTRLATTEPRERTSGFVDSSWVTPTRLAAATTSVAPGSTYRFTFNLHAPEQPGTYTEHFGLLEEGVAWFGDPGQGGPADNAFEAQIVVVPREQPVSVDGGTEGGVVVSTADGDPDGPVVGGCSVSGGAVAGRGSAHGSGNADRSALGPWWLALAVGVEIVRRRRLLVRK